MSIKNPALLCTSACFKAVCVFSDQQIYETELLERKTAYSRKAPPSDASFGGELFLWVLTNRDICGFRAKQENACSVKTDVLLWQGLAIRIQCNLFRETLRWICNLCTMHPDPLHEKCPRLPGRILS